MGGSAAGSPAFAIGVASWTSVVASNVVAVACFAARAFDVCVPVALAL
jgi:hypothetical protein